MKVSKITIKVIISYTLLVCVSLVAGYVILKEINKLSEQETINQQDRAKIVQVTKIITLVNDAENASRAAIRTDDKEALYVFLQKNLHLQTEILMFRRDISSEKQLFTLDTITSLLKLKSQNLQELKSYQERDSSSIIIRAAINKLSSLEPYLGYELYTKNQLKKKNVSPKITPAEQRDRKSVV